AVAAQVVLGAGALAQPARAAVGAGGREQECATGRVAHFDGVAVATLLARVAGDHGGAGAHRAAERARGDLAEGAHPALLDVALRRAALGAVGAGLAGVGAAHTRRAELWQGEVVAARGRLFFAEGDAVGAVALLGAGGAGVVAHGHAQAGRAHLAAVAREGIRPVETAGEFLFALLHAEARADALAGGAAVDALVGAHAARADGAVLARGHRRRPIGAAAQANRAGAEAVLRAVGR